MSRADVVGLVSCAGQARRLPRLPSSKELLAVGFAPDGAPRPVSRFLLERMLAAGIERALLVLRSGKWDLPAYYGDGRELGMSLGYLALEASGSIPETLDAAFPWVHDRRVAMGFPDVLFEPPDAFARLLDRLEAGAADAVLGLFPTDRPEKADMVELDSDGRIVGIAVKPRASELRYTWLTAAWTPRFGAFLHSYLASPRRPPAVAAGERELYPSDVFQAAIEDGLAVAAIPFPDGSHLDVGTPDDLARAVRRGLEG